MPRPCFFYLCFDLASAIGRLESLYWFFVLRSHDAIILRLIWQVLRFGSSNSSTTAGAEQRKTFEAVTSLLQHKVVSCAPQTQPEECW